ncbi:putative pantetheine-phosphate adenylyltransferase [Microsporum audouinii]
MAEGRHEALLLLTDTPSTFAALKSTYGHALSNILPALTAAIKDASRPAVLDVAVFVHGLRPQSDGRKPFVQLQRFLADFYKLLATVSVSVSVELDGPGGIDARVFFLDPELESLADSYPYGPIVGMTSLLSSNRSWDTVYLPSGGGEGVARLTSMFRADGKRITDTRTLELKPPGPGQQRSTALIMDSEASQLAAAHFSVAVGGTFDHLHAGHKLLLTATILALDTCSSQLPAQRQKRVVTVGITGDELLVNKKYAEFLESWEERWKGVWAFLRSIIDFSTTPGEVGIKREFESGPNGRRVVVSLSPDLEVRFVQIADPFGPTITDQDITALVVSKETRSGGKAVNDERLKKGWSALEVFEVDVLDSTDGVSVSEDSFEAKISSTEIRRRQMNRAKGSL